jgi:hypothetical protein
MCVQVARDPRVLSAAALAELRLLLRGADTEAIVLYALLVYGAEFGASVGWTYDVINDIALALGSAIESLLATLPADQHPHVWVCLYGPFG